MKFMLMMHAPRGTGDWSVFKWPPEDLKAHINFMKRFGKELKDSGELVAAEGLAAPDQARVVRASRACRSLDRSLEPAQLRHPLANDRGRAALPLGHDLLGREL